MPQTSIQAYQHLQNALAAGEDAIQHFEAYKETRYSILTEDLKYLKATPREMATKPDAVFSAILKMILLDLEFLELLTKSKSNLEEYPINMLLEFTNLTWRFNYFLTSRIKPYIEALCSSHGFIPQLKYDWQSNRLQKISLLYDELTSSLLNKLKPYADALHPLMHRVYLEAWNTDTQKDQAIITSILEQSKKLTESSETEENRALAKYNQALATYRLKTEFNTENTDLSDQEIYKIVSTQAQKKDPLAQARLAQLYGTHFNGIPNSKPEHYQLSAAVLFEKSSRQNCYLGRDFYNNNYNHTHKIAKTNQLMQEKNLSDPLIAAGWMSFTKSGRFFLLHLGRLFLKTSAGNLPSFSSNFSLLPSSILLEIASYLTGLSNLALINDIINTFITLDFSFYKHRMLKELNSNLSTCDTRAYALYTDIENTSNLETLSKTINEHTKTNTNPEGIRSIQPIYTLALNTDPEKTKQAQKDLVTQKINDKIKSANNSLFVDTWKPKKEALEDLCAEIQKNENQGKSLKDVLDQWKIKKLEHRPFFGKSKTVTNEQLIGTHRNPFAFFIKAGEKTATEKFIGKLATDHSSLTL